MVAYKETNPEKRDKIKARIKEHFDAGATHVCIQPVNPNGKFGDLHWDALQALAE